MEWYCYATLGVLTAILSFTMDLGVTKLLRGEHTYTLHTDHYHYYYYNYFLLLCLCWLSAHQWLYTKLEGHSLLQFCCWTLYPACLCAVAASFCDNVCPASTGLSGMLFGGAGLSAAASYELTLVLLKKTKKAEAFTLLF